MKKLLLFIAALSLLPGLAFAKCGDNTCGLNENTQTCPIDCKILAAPSNEYFVGNGPAIRGTPFRKGMVLSSVITKNGRAVLQFSIYDVNLKEIYKANVLSRPLTGKGELGNPQPLVGPDGAIYIAFRDHLLSGMDDPVYRLRVIKSGDNGRNWDYLDDPQGLIDVGPDGLWEPYLYFDANDDLRVVYAKERSNKICAKQRGKKQDIVTKVSHDKGRTWSSERVVAGDGVSRDGVPSVTRLNDGSYVVVFESWQSSVCGVANPNLLIKSMQSPDGIVWKNRSVVFDPYDYSRGQTLATWPFVSVMKDGRAIVSFTSNYRNIKFNLNKKVRLEEVKTYDVLLMSSSGKPQLTKLFWDKNSLVTAFPYDETSGSSNRYASLVVLNDGRIVVFSGLPDRFVLLDFKDKIF